MVRMRVRYMLAALGVLIAFAMTPRAALAVTLEDFPSSPIAQYQVGSAPSLLTPSEVLGGTTYASNVYPDTTFSNVFGGYSESTDGRNTYDFTSKLYRHYDYVFGNYDITGMTTGTNVYFDFYFVANNWTTFPSTLEYSVVTPSLVQPVLRRYMTSQPATTFDFLPVGAFVVDEVKYYQKRIVAEQPTEQWVNVPSNATASMRYPFHAQALNGTIGIKGFVVRGHVTLPTISTGGYDDVAIYFALDDLKVRVVLYDSDIMETINGTSSQSSTGVPVTTTITTTTNKQTNTLMDTSGSEQIVTGQTDGGVDGFVSRFGFVAQTLELATSLYQAIINAEQKTWVDFPGITVLGYTLAEPQRVYIWQNGLLQIYQPIADFLHGFMCVSWVIWIYNDFRKSFLDLEDVE